VLGFACSNGIKATVGTTIGKKEWAKKEAK
jgi:hypothetical protein